MSYWDSSALVKLYLKELDSAEFRALALNANGFALEQDYLRYEPRNGKPLVFSQIAPGYFRSLVGPNENSALLRYDGARSSEEGHRIKPAFSIGAGRGCCGNMRRPGGHRAH